VLNETLRDDKGRRVEWQLLPGLSDAEIAEAEARLATSFPPDVVDLLRFSRGFKLRDRRFYEAGPDEGGGTAAFVDRDWTGYPGWASEPGDRRVPRGLEILSDICGNPWVVDIDASGRWGSVFYVSHDPPIIMYQARDLAEFLLEFFLYFTEREKSRWINPDENSFRRVPLLRASDLRNSGDAALRAFAGALEDADLLADLRARMIGGGFAWDHFGPGTGVRRHGQDLLFALIRPRRIGFFRSLFGRR
jgi:cell wall assembly regulator SMI1